MKEISSANREFLKNFYNILPHHVNCILRSGMMLDEDMSLLTTFWDPHFYRSPRGFSRRALTSASLATVGLATALRLNSVYPLLLSALPTTLYLMEGSLNYYRRRQYERNFERLVCQIRSVHYMNREIAQYYSKRDAAFQDGKLHAAARDILEKPGEDFLRLSIRKLYEIIEKIRASMLDVYRSIPISEGDFIATFEWNLDGFQMTDDDEGLAEMRKRFNRLSDLFLLIASNFLGFLGLSCCVQLWREPCNLRHVFNRVIPEVVGFLDGSIGEVGGSFDRIRFNLCSDVPIGKEEDLVKVSRLNRPITDLLLSLQVTFEMAKRLRQLESEGNTSHCLEMLDDITRQMNDSRDMLSILLNRFLSVTSQTPSQKAPLELAPHTTDPIEVTVEHEDENIRELQDEEYNLSIHGSEPEDTNWIPDDTADASVENLNVVLLELKNKLLRHEGKLGKTAREESDRGDVIKSKPAEEPPRLPPILPDAGDVNGLLRAVTFTARQLNRSEEFQFGFNMFPEIPRPFNTTYRCFSVAMLPGNERQDVEKGGKIIMPPSALEQLTRLNINYPMQFKIVNKNTDRTSHCGVLEFVADEGKVYLPLWMMHNLVLEEGDSIQIESVSLPVGTFAKFQPLSPEFLDITNPKAVLENCLRTFSCLTSGDVIAVQYNQRVYELCVLETQPGKAISIIECDMNVEFAAPVGYKETEVVKQPEEGMAVDPADLMPEPAGFVAFRGTGNRLDGKRRKDSASKDGGSPKPVYVRGIPDYDYQIGTLRFLRQTPKSEVNSKDESEEFKAFSGEGFSLRQRN